MCAKSELKIEDFVFTGIVFSSVSPDKVFNASSIQVHVNVTIAKRTAMQILWAEKQTGALYASNMEGFGTRQITSQSEAPVAIDISQSLDGLHVIMANESGTIFSQSFSDGELSLDCSSNESNAHMKLNESLVDVVDIAYYSVK